MAVSWPWAVPRVTNPRKNEANTEMKAFVFCCVLLLAGTAGAAESPRVFLAGSNARLLSVLPLGDGTILAGGEASDLDWLPKETPRIELAAEAANGWKMPASEGEDAKRRAVLLHLSPDLGKVLCAAAFPAGVGGGGIASIKTDTVPGGKTGGLYIAGGSSKPATWWLAKLDANFVDARPAKLVWGYHDGLGRIGKVPIDAIWDVGGDGKIVFYNNPKHDWGVVCRLKADGSGLDSVPEWRDSHGLTQPDGSEAKTLSLKTGSGDLRSRTWEEFLALTPDGNGGFRQGSFPDDFYYAGPFGAQAAGRGYSGYASRNNAATTAAIAVDRRTNGIYLGYNVQSILPSWSDIPNAPDFEPAVVAFSKNGALRWWSRLYSEISTNSGPFVSSDAGQSWTKLGEGFVFGRPRQAVVVDRTIFVAGPTGLTRLKPGGKWEMVRDAGDLQCIVPAGEKNLFAGGGGGRIMKSTDLGETWKPLDPGLPPGKKPVVALAVSPGQPARMFAAVKDTGVFVSQDSGSTWVQTGAAKGAYMGLVISPGDPGAVYVLSGNALEKSTDAGATWSRLNVPGGNFTSLAIDPDTPDTLFVGSSKGGSGIRASTDGGRTWKEEKVGNEKIETVICLAGSDAVFCGSSDRGLFRRGSDGKNDWTRLDKAPGLLGSRQSVLCLLSDPATPGRVIAFCDGAGNTSTPDQYVDAVAVDYSLPADKGEIVVLARAHGNNYTNFWSGMEGKSFMRRQTGTKGNDHYQWIGRLKAGDGTFVNSTWFVGLDPSSSSFGQPYKDPNLAGWPDHNGGNANLKGAQGRGLALAPDGSVAVVGTSRAAITTAGAFQKMTSPFDGKAPWHDFFRVHAADLSTVTYATALTGEGWDSVAGEGAGNTCISAVAALPNGGFVAVGFHKGTGNTIPTANIPSWGKDRPDGETAMLGLFPSVSLAKRPTSP